MPHPTITPDRPLSKAQARILHRKKNWCDPVDFQRWRDETNQHVCDLCIALGLERCDFAISSCKPCATRRRRCSVAEAYRKSLFMKWCEIDSNTYDQWEKEWTPARISTQRQKLSERKVKVKGGLVAVVKRGVDGVKEDTRKDGQTTDLEGDGPMNADDEREDGHEGSWDSVVSGHTLPGATPSAQPAQSTQATDVVAPIDLLSTSKPLQDTTLTAIKYPPLTITLPARSPSSVKKPTAINSADPPKKRRKKKGYVTTDSSNSDDSDAGPGLNGSYWSVSASSDSRRRSRALPNVTSRADGRPNGKPPGRRPATGNGKPGRKSQSKTPKTETETKTKTIQREVKPGVLPSSDRLSTPLSSESSDLSDSDSDFIDAAARIPPTALTPIPTSSTMEPSVGNQHKDNPHTTEITSTILPPRTDVSHPRSITDSPPLQSLHLEYPGRSHSPSPVISTHPASNTPHDSTHRPSTPDLEGDAQMQSPSGSPGRPHIDKAGSAEVETAATTSSDVVVDTRRTSEVSPSHRKSSTPVTEKSRSPSPQQLQATQLGATQDRSSLSDSHANHTQVSPAPLVVVSSKHDSHAASPSTMASALPASIVDTVTQLQTLISERDRLLSENAQLQTAQATLTTSVADGETRTQHLETTVRNLKDEIEYAKDLVEWEKRISKEVKDDKEKLAQEKEVLEEKVLALSNELKDVKREVEDLRKRVQEARSTAAERSTPKSSHTIGPHHSDSREIPPQGVPPSTLGNLLLTEMASWSSMSMLLQQSRSFTSRSLSRLDAFVASASSSEADHDDLPSARTSLSDGKRADIEDEMFRICKDREAFLFNVSGLLAPMYLPSVEGSVTSPSVDLQRGPKQRDDDDEIEEARKARERIKFLEAQLAESEEIRSQGLEKASKRQEELRRLHAMRVLKGKTSTFASPLSRYDDDWEDGSISISSRRPRTDTADDRARGSWRSTLGSMSAQPHISQDWRIQDTAEEDTILPPRKRRVGQINGAFGALDSDDGAYLKRRRRD